MDKLIVDDRGKHWAVVFHSHVENSLGNKLQAQCMLTVCIFTHTFISVKTSICIYADFKFLAPY